MYTFTKEERLCGEKLISSLFHNGSSFVLYPFRVTWLPREGDGCSRVLVSVPKRRFKRAVDRNLLKRRIREAYRLAKGGRLYSFTGEQHIHLHLALAYVGKEILPFSLIDKKLMLVFDRLQKLCHERIVE